jgi:hypothetical protein
MDQRFVGPRARNVVVTSSCGVCGGREAIDNGLLDLPVVSDILRVEKSQLGRMI